MGCCPEVWAVILTGPEFGGPSHHLDRRRSRGRLDPDHVQENLSGGDD
jgi:hypothetical protein